MYRLLLILFVGLFASCKQDSFHVPNGILKPDSLAAIQADFYIVEAAYNLTFVKPDSLLPQYEDYYKAVMEQHHTQKSQIDSSIKFYAKHPEEYKKVYAKSLELLEVKKIKAASKK